MWTSFWSEGGGERGSWTNVVVIKVDIEAALYLKADEEQFSTGAAGCYIYICLVVIILMSINFRFNVLGRRVTYHSLSQIKRYRKSSCKELPLVGWEQLWQYERRARNVRSERASWEKNVGWMVKNGPWTLRRPRPTTFSRFWYIIINVGSMRCYRVTYVFHI